MDKNKNKGKRIITNSDDLNNYLTKNKLSEFKRQIDDFNAITKEVDKKILDLKKILHYKHDADMVLDEYDLNILISALLK